MKSVFVFLLAVVCLPASLSRAKPDDLAVLRSCLNDLKKDREGAANCYDVALPWAHSSSLEGKALYLISLTFYLEAGSNRGSFDSIGNKLVAYYQRHLEKKINATDFQSLKDAELVALFDALQGTHFYGSIVHSAGIAVAPLKEVFAEIETRKAATQEQASEIFRMFLSSHHWEDARKIQRRWPSVFPEEIPKILMAQEISAEQLGYYSLSSDSSELTLKRFKFEEGVHIVMSGDCHFAIDAMKILNQKSDLAELMDSHGLVVGATSFKGIRELRSLYPKFEMHVTFNESAWYKKGVDTFVMPSFTFFKNGKRIHSFSGSTPQLLSNFCAGLKSVGLNPKSCTRRSS